MTKARSRYGCQLRTLTFLLAFACAGVGALAQAAPTLAIGDLGRGAVALDGPWQFHLGDNPAWASPQIDDATGQNGWAQITMDKPWGQQGYRSYAGFAWYRKHLSVTPVPGTDGKFVLQLPLFDSIAQVYWNGILLGSTGKMPPHPSWPADGCSCTSLARTIPLGAVHSGVLAIRLWMNPLMSTDPGTYGGFTHPIHIGSAAAIADREHAAAYHFLREMEYSYALQCLAALVMAFSLIGWFRDRSQKVLLWLAVYCAGQVTGTLVELLGPTFTFGERSVFFSVADIGSLIAIWFLLIYLLRLDDMPWLMRTARWAGWIAILATLVDSSFYLRIFDLGNPAVVQAVQAADWVLTPLVQLCMLLPMLLLVAVIRRRSRLDAARWTVAIFAFLRTMIETVAWISMLGARFTHWTLGSRLYTPLFTLGGTGVDVITLVNTGFFISIIYAALRYSRETLRRQQIVEQELKSAQELQQVLIPDELPSLAGFAVTSGYRPAQEVGGDFFQIIPLGEPGANQPASALIVLGDVSGKGLRAAMTVSLIVGTLRTLAETSSHPAEILAGLNRRLCGRLHGGFATCLAVKLDANGHCTLANAGHPAPFVNGEEVSAPGALPLGVAPGTAYEETTLHLRPGDHFVLYTDGLLEARNNAGELFGFDRLRDLVSARPDAAQSIDAAVRFGQQDDITVLTLTRLAVGEEARIHVLAPVLTPA